MRDGAETLHEALSSVLAQTVPDFEVIVVDDGSTDGTSEEVRRLAEELPAARLVVHERNRGYGAALKSGIHAAEADVVAITDAPLMPDIPNKLRADLDLVKRRMSKEENVSLCLPACLCLCFF